MNDFSEIQSLQEDFDIEFKQASGRDGKGIVPKSFWPTYSAMANTSGGYVFFGLKEIYGSKPSEVTGIPDVNSFKKELWDGLNNKQKASVNILTNQNISVLTLESKNIIKIYIPQATRKQRPVYISGNPLTGTYRRNHEGDYLCQEDTVRQMLGEQNSDTRDYILLDKFSLTDIELDTLKAYRQNFSNQQPTHPFNDHNDIEFLRNIGGWIIDRQTKREGLSLAGLLMFGKLRSILDAVPNYILDYQEQPRLETETRWIDRITTDFTWSGNLFDFYRKVINRLYQDLKVPFTLKGDERIDDTPVHEALREALVNTIIHADYSGTCSILVVKRSDLFSFRNPGLLRVPRQEAIKGGVSDCRNRNLQKMFQLIGRGDQAGSGFPKIFRGWSWQNWRSPNLEEKTELNQTSLILSMNSLLPEIVVEQLKKELGKTFASLSKSELIALVTAKAEKCVNHSRLKELTTEHPADLTKTLHNLVEKQLLISEGAGKATFYFVPGEHPITNESNLSSVHNGGSSVHNGGSSVHNGGKSGNNQTDALNWQLQQIVVGISGKKRVKPQEMREIIVELCKIRELTASELAELLGRTQETIRIHYLAELCEQGLLRRKFPNIKNHPEQRYGACK